jgi:hypothetical protein
MITSGANWQFIKDVTTFGGCILNQAILGYGLTQNIGDPVQSYAMLELLKNPDISIVDRDRISDFAPKEETQLIASGWMIGNADFVEFNENVYAVGVSLHLSGWPYFGRTRQLTNEFAVDNHFLGEFRKLGNIGARDLFTMGELRRNGIDSFFSGCATLTFADRKSQKKIDILCIDVDEDVVNYLRSDLHREVYVSTNVSPPQNQEFMTIQKISDVSEPYLELISSASVVITSRLHAALPAVSQNVPVIFAPNDRFDSRFSGYSALLPYIVSASDLKSFVAPLLESIAPASFDLEQIKNAFKNNLDILIRGNGNVEREINSLPLKFTLSEKETLSSQKNQKSKISIYDVEALYDSLEKSEHERDELTQQRDELTQQRDELIAELGIAVAEHDRFKQALTSELDQIAADRDEANAKLEAVVNSRIWRFTKFYRESRLRRSKR